MSLNDEMKKVLLAGVGAIATTVEKSSEIVDTLIKKGEITVEQGKVLNEELKRNIKDTVKSRNANPSSDLLSQLEGLSDVEIAAIKLKLAEMEKSNDGQTGIETPEA